LREDLVVLGLNNEELMDGLKFLSVQHNKTEATLLMYIAEVENRRLYAEAGYSSLFKYLIEELRYSEDAAAKRIHVARVAKRMPQVFGLLSEGKVSLTALSRLAPYLFKPNGFRLLEQSQYKSVREVERLIVSYFPKADVPDSVNNTTTPLSVDRVHVSFSASKEFAEDLKKAQDLLRHKYPQGKLRDVLGEALKILVQKKTPSIMHQAKKKASKPKEHAPGHVVRKHPLASRYIPQAVKMAVWERDKGCCTFVSSQGKRCGESGFLQWDHKKPFSLGGSSLIAENIRLLCASHNLLLAERVYGKAFVDRKISVQGHHREPPRREARNGNL